MLTRQQKRSGVNLAPVISGETTNKTGSTNYLETDSIDNEGSGAVDMLEDHKPAVIPAENQDPLRRRISKRRGRIAIIISKIWGRINPFRKPLPEETLAKQQRAEQDKLKKLLKSEAKLFKARIINCLTRLGICYRYKISEQDYTIKGVQQVRFSHIYMGVDAIYFRVDTMRLPRDIGILNLVEETVLTDLSLAVGHRVNAKYHPDYGAWLIVERATGTLGIPKHVRLIDLLAGIPASADGLTIPLGLGANSRPIYKSFSNMYSMLVGGTIGAGKSNILNVIICSLIRRNNPERLKLILVDLKGGLEFSFYEGIPHLIKMDGIAPEGIVYDRAKVPETLEYLLHLGEKRISQLKTAGYKDIGRYNARNRKNYLPHIFLVIDEWADIKLDRKLGTVSEALLTNICQRFRAAGIHVIVCTQVPKSEVVNTRIKGVLPAILAFSCPTNQSSMAIIDTGAAKSLVPAGRAILRHTEEMQLQTPFITDGFIADTVAGAIRGEYTKLTTGGHDVSELEVQEYAINNDSGWLSINRLYNIYRSRGITRAELSDWLASWEDKTYIIGSSQYKVIGASGSRPRRLISLDNMGEYSDEDNIIENQDSD